MPGFDALLRATLGRLQDLVALRHHLSKAKPVAEVSPDTAADWAEVIATLDPVDPVPLFVGEGAMVNGFTMGVRQPHVVLTRAAVDTLSRRQRKAILAHELGHVMSGHVMYKTLVRAVETTRWWVLPGGANLVLTAPLLLALYAWDRKSELSADRAELLAVQDLDTCLRLLRSAHAPQVQAAQARYRRIAAYSKAGADVAAALERAFAKHPPIDERIAELEAWHASPAYRAILGGDYPRRDPDLLRAQALEDRVGVMRAGLAAQLADVGQDAATRASALVAWFNKQTGGRGDDGG